MIDSIKKLSRFFEKKTFCNFLFGSYYVYVLRKGNWFTKTSAYNLPKLFDSPCFQLSSNCVRVLGIAKKKPCQIHNGIAKMWLVGFELRYCSKISITFLSKFQLMALSLLLHTYILSFCMRSERLGWLGTPPCLARRAFRAEKETFVGATTYQALV